LISLVVGAVAIRVFFAFLIRFFFGDILPFQLWGFDTECYGDFNSYYSYWIPGLWKGTWYPYMSSEGPESSLIYTTINLPWGEWVLSFGQGVAANYYFMTPVFLYFLLPFGYPLFPPQLLAIPLILTDSLTIIPLYLTIKELGKDDRLALYGSILYLLSPLNIFYLGVVWLSTGPIIFLFVWSIYFLVRKEYQAANLCFALTIMTKQIVLFFMLPFYIIVFLQCGWKAAGKRFGEFSLVCFLLSLPYILLTPVDYILHVWGPQPLPALQGNTELPDNRIAVNLQHTALALNLDTFLGGTFFQFFAILFNTYILLILAIFFVSGILIYYYKTDNLTNLNISYVFCLYGFTFHLFFVRGIYKYFLPLLIPLFIITLIFPVHNFLEKKSQDQNRNTIKIQKIILPIVLGLVFIVLGVIYVIISRVLGHLLLFLLTLFVSSVILGRILEQTF
ncbi:MAG: hypothetical protein ACFFBD_23180, partial [Candidatus Hodarchaeota archaeon]